MAAGGADSAGLPRWSAGRHLAPGQEAAEADADDPTPSGDGNSAAFDATTYGAAHQPSGV